MSLDHQEHYTLSDKRPPLKGEILIVILNDFLSILLIFKEGQWKKKEILKLVDVKI